MSNLAGHPNLAGQPNSPGTVASQLPDLEQQLRVFKTLSSIVDFTYAFDRQCCFLYANQALLDLLCLRLDEIIGKTFLELPYPYSLAVRLHAQVRQVFDTHERLIDETVYTSPTGKTACYEYIFNPVFEPDGTVEIVAGSTRDVSHRKVNEEAQGRLASIIDSCDDAIVSKDLAGIVTSWNSAAERIYGYSAQEMVGTAILRLIPVELHGQEEDVLSKIRAGKRIDHYETTRIRKNGEMFPVSLTVSPIRNSSNVVVGTSKIARDISSRKQMERTLVQAEKIATMGRMAATIAHEINNPLESLSNLVFLARGSTADQEALEYLTMAELEIERISLLTRQTLGYYRDLGGPRGVACHQLIDEVLRGYQSKIQTRRILVETVFDTLRPVQTSRGELMQVLSAIISNAVDAMPNGGRLSLRVSESDGSQIEILTQDEGIGIPAENLPRIFEPFFTTKGNLGTGIGLWVAKELVEKHGGQIEVTSEAAPLKGTRVRVSLPLIKDQRTDLEQAGTMAAVRG